MRLTEYISDVTVPMRRCLWKQKLQGAMDTAYVYGSWRYNSLTVSTEARLLPV